MRIFFSGDEGRARNHYPIARSKVNAFVNRCERSGLKQNTFAFIFKETGTQVFASYSFGQVQMRVHSPVISLKEEPIEIVPAVYPSLVVFAGDETLGYNIAILDTVGDGVLYGRADTADEIIATLPPLDQREHHTRRYSLKTDRGAFDATEYLSENYVESGVINLFSTTSPGIKCSPTIPYRCPEFPGSNSYMYQCQSTDTDGAGVLGYLVETPVTQSIAVAFTTRAWCYDRNISTHHSFWAQKREITTATTNSVNRVMFGSDVYEVRGDGRVDAPSSVLATFYGLFSDEYICTTDWADNGEFNVKQLVGYGSLIVEYVNTPVGPALTIGADMRERIRSFYNSDPDQLAYGKEEPFTASIEDELYSSAIAIGETEEGTVPIGVYAYSDPAVFTSHATSTATFYSPLTRYESAKGTPEFISAFDGATENDVITYSNIEGKNISFSVEYNGLTYEVYFKNFLEAKFTHVPGLSSFTKSDVVQISVGAASLPKSDGYAFITKLHDVFAKFRADDIETARITEDDPWPVYGSVMCYLYERGNGSNYLEDEVELFNLINAERASISLTPLSVNIDLCVAARIHAEDMATNEFLDHEGSDGSWPSQRIDGTGFCGGATEHLEIGENCGFGYDTPLDQFNAWKASSAGHYEAMINTKFREIGLAIAANNGVAYRCAVFAGDSDI